MVAQYFSGVFAPVPPALLQYGDDLVDKLSEVVRHGRGRDVKAVATGFIEYGFHLVSHLFRLPDNLRAANRCTVDFPDFAHGQFVFSQVSGLIHLRENVQ